MKIVVTLFVVIFLGFLTRGDCQKINEITIGYVWYNFLDKTETQYSRALGFRRVFFPTEVEYYRKFDTKNSIGLSFDYFVLYYRNKLTPMPDIDPIIYNRIIGSVFLNYRRDLLNATKWNLSIISGLGFRKGIETFIIGFTDDPDFPEPISSANRLIDFSIKGGISVSYNLSNRVAFVTKAESAFYLSQFSNTILKASIMLRYKF